MRVENLAKWLYQQFARLPIRAGELWHDSESGPANAPSTGDCLNRRDLTDLGNSAQAAADALADDWYEQIHTHAEAFPGENQRFRILIYGKSRTEPIAKTVFSHKVAGDAFQWDQGLQKGERGLMAQLMRHLEASHRANAEMMSMSISALKDENNSLREFRDKFEERRLEQFELIEELLSAKSERKIASRRAIHEQGMKQKAVDQLFDSFGPKILASLPSRGSKNASEKHSKNGENGENGENGAIFTSRLKDLIGGLNEDAFSAIQDKLTEDQQNELAALMGMKK